MYRFLTTLLIICVIACQQADRSAPTLIATNDSYSLVWADEFDYKGLPDSSKWGYDVGDACALPCGCGWGNNELQYYTKNNLNNARVADGMLTIELHQEKTGTRDYSSARLVSKGKGDWKYGKIEIRARVESSLGTWAAIWMLPTDDKYGGWPSSGEIDIMEKVGWNPDSIIATAHTEAYNHMIGTHKGSMLEVLDSHHEFNDYVLEWTEDAYQVFVNDEQVFEFKNEGTGHKAWPFDQRFHLIMNIAFGGNLGGKKGIDPGKLPCKMEVDYVRVYQKEKKPESGKLSHNN